MNNGQPITEVCKCGASFTGEIYYDRTEQLHREWQAEHQLCSPRKIYYIEGRDTRPTAIGKAG